MACPTCGTLHPRLPEVIEAGPLRILPRQQVMERAGAAPVQLGANETALLVALARQKGRPVSSDALLQLVDVQSRNSLDVAITRLRRKLPAGVRILGSTRGWRWLEVDAHA